MWRINPLIGIISFFSVCLVFYVFQTQQYPVWDEHHYLSIAIETLNSIESKGITGIFDIVQISKHRQPIYSFVLTIILLIFGTAYTYKIALLLNTILFSLTIFGVYKLANYFYSKKTGLIAAFLFASCTNALFYAHFSYVETAVTMTIIWSLVALLNTQNFASKKWSLIAGFIGALSTLTRFVAPVFIFGPIILSVIYLLFSLINMSKHSMKMRLTNMLIYLAIIVFVPITIYFIPNFSSFIEYVKNNQSYGPEWVATYRNPDMANTFSIRSIMYYFNILQQNTIYTFILFVLGLISLFHNFIFSLIRKNFKQVFFAGYLLITFFIPYSFLTFITIWKEDRFLVPLYPFIAIISAFGINSMFRFLKFVTSKNTNLQIFFLTIIVAIGLLNTMGALFGIGPMGQKGLVDYITPRWIPHPRRIYLTPLVWPPTKEYANAQQFVDIIKSVKKSSAMLKIVMDFNHEPFQNAVNSILIYQERSIAYPITQITTQIPNDTDYIVTKINNDHFLNCQKIAKMLIPMDNVEVEVVDAQSCN